MISIDGGLRGYQVLQFILMYVIGYYIRENAINKLLSKGKWIILYLVSSGVLYVIFSWNRGLATEYCSPIVILQAVTIFCLFLSIKIRYSRLINEVAKGSFVVYLIHVNILSLLRISRYAVSEWYIMVFHLTVSVIISYFIGYILYKLYQLLSTRIWKGLEEAYPNFEICYFDCQNDIDNSAGL